MVKPTAVHPHHSVSLSDRKEWTVDTGNNLEGSQGHVGLPWQLSGQRSCLLNRGRKRCGFNLWVGKIPWRRKLATLCSTLARKFPWTEEPGGLQSKGSQRARHHWVTLHAHKAIMRHDKHPISKDHILQSSIYITFWSDKECTMWEFFVVLG